MLPPIRFAPDSLRPTRDAVLALCRCRPRTLVDLCRSLSRPPRGVLPVVRRLLAEGAVTRGPLGLEVTPCS
jgi:hypothetical protein